LKKKHGIITRLQTRFDDNAGGLSATSWIALMTTTISLVRHGEVYNPQALYYGRLPRYRLSATGRKQAADTAAYLAAQTVANVYSSPLLRARQTAGIIAARLALPVRYSNLLLEVHSPHDGQTQAVMAQRDWDLYTGSSDQFEQPADVVKRLVRFFGRIRQNHPNQHTIAVSHADPLAWATQWATGQPLTLHGRRHLSAAGLPVDYPTYACVISLVFEKGENRPKTLTFFAPP
jgi:broad specificity phosphatase PhoE